MRRIVNTLGIIAHTVIGWGSFAAWTMFVGACILLDTVFGPHRRFSARALTWAWGTANFWTSPTWRAQVRGREHVRRGPYILVSNHQSMVDIPMVLGLGAPARVCARAGLFHTPLLGAFFSLSRQVRAERLLEDGTASLGLGLSVVVFPEGTRSTTGAIGRFHTGAFHLAFETGAPVIPVVCDGGQRILPKGGWFPLDPVVRLHVQALAPLEPGEFESPRAMAVHIHDLLVARLAELRHARDPAEQSVAPEPEVPA